MQSSSSSTGVKSTKRAYKLAKVAPLLAAGVFAIFGAAQKSQAQNLVITNARIIVGNGQVIEHGGILVRDGRIAAVVSGEAPAAPPGTQTIDASGFTVMPGFIDDHRHLVGRAENFLPLGRTRK